MSICFTPKDVVAVRLTILDACKRAQYGPCSVFVIDPIAMERSSDIDAGTTTSRRTLSGRLCGSARTTPDVYNHDQWTLTPCTLDPELLGALNDNFRRLHDFRGEVSGWDEGYDTASNNAVAIEFWMNADTAGEADICEDDQVDVEGVWMYVLVPATVNWRLGDTTSFQSDQDVEFTVQGITAHPVRWGVGPHDVILNEVGQPGPLLEPVPTDRRIRWEITTVPPPEPFCGCAPLSNPLAPMITVSRDDSDPTNRTLCFDSPLADPDRTWLIDFGDGSTPVELTPGEAVCHRFADDGCYYVGLWREDATRVYRAVEVCVPMTMTAVVEPTSGTSPLEVTLTVEGAAGPVEITW